MAVVVVGSKTAVFSHLLVVFTLQGSYGGLKKGSRETHRKRKVADSDRGQMGRAGPQCF